MTTRGRGKGKRRNGGYRSSYQIGYGDRRLSYKYRYQPASHVPGHMIDTYTGKSVYMNNRTGGFIGLENKFIDLAVESDAFATSWATMEDATAKSISAVAQGDTENTRDGRIYHINSIHVRMRIHKVAAEAGVNPLPQLHGRVILVWDKQSNGTQVVASDVMDETLNDKHLVYRNLANSSRFVVLFDYNWNLPIQQMAQGGIDLFANGIVNTDMFTFNKKFKKPVKVVCTGTGGTISVISDNSFHIIGVSNSASALLNMTSRVRFYG